MAKNKRAYQDLVLRMPPQRYVFSSSHCVVRTTPMVDYNVTDAASSVTVKGDTTVLTAPGIGSVSLSTSGVFSMADASGNVIVSSPKLLAYTGGAGKPKDACALVQPGTDSNGSGRRTSSFPNGLAASSQAKCCRFLPLKNTTPRGFRVSFALLPFLCPSAFAKRGCLCVARLPLCRDRSP